MAQITINAAGITITVAIPDDGFLYIPSGAGAPAKNHAPKNGATYYDRTSGVKYAYYAGAWHAIEGED